MERDELRRLLLVATIAALSLTALIAIAALIAADFGETELRILATTAGFGFATLLAMRGNDRFVCILCNGRRVERPAGPDLADSAP